GRMAVDDHFAVLRLAREKGIADIEKVPALLHAERHARPYPGVTEEIVSHSCRILQRFEEPPMTRWQAIRERRLDRLEIPALHGRANSDPVRVDGFERP